jgi:hypothetical protein
MTFSIRNWARSSVSANEPAESVTDTSISGSPVIYGCYREYLYQTADAQATVAASGYFNQNTSGTAIAYNGVAVDIVTGDYVKVYSSADSSLVTYRLTNTSGVITTSFVGGTVTLTPTVSLTQFLAAYATPLLVAAAPGAGLVYTNVRAVISMVYGSAQLANGGDSYIQYTSTANGAGPMATSSVSGTGIAALTASSAWAYGSGATTASPATPTVTNAGLYLTNASAPFITGTGATFTMKLRAEILAA